jgi:methionine synthase I (cobalamin-dependent)
LEDVHSSFLQSGSNAITTNSYGVVPGVGFDEHQISDYMQQSGKIARSALQKHNDQSNATAFVFGSLGPLIESYRPDMIMSHDEGVKCYKLACNSLASYADAFLAETMSCVDESIQVLEAVAFSSDAQPTPGSQRRCLLISYCLDSKGDFRDGEKITNGIRRVLKEAEKRSGEIQSKLRCSDTTKELFFTPTPSLWCHCLDSSIS